MTFGELLTSVYGELQDSLQTAWTNTTVARSVTKAVRKVANKVGRDDARTTLSLVASQQEYDLPAGVRRVNKVQIIPESGTEPLAAGLTQVRLQDIPVTVQDETDPDRFALSLTGGTDSDQYSLFFWPAPARSAVDAIVISYSVDTVISSDSPATTPQKAVALPFPAQFEDAILYYTMSFMLAGRGDEGDREEAMKYKALAEQELRENAPVDAISARRDCNRAMP